MFKYGNGTNTFYVVAESVNMGMSFIDIKITDNENWAKNGYNKIIAKVKANSLEEAKALFRVRDMTR
jgi:peptidyl-tRNA hydrolase